MNIKKNLILLTNNYPASSGEFFIDDEMKIISKYFEKIIVITNNQIKSEFICYTPKNLILVTYSINLTYIDKYKTIPFLFNSFFFNELFFAIKKLKITPFIMLFKIMFMDLARALKLKKVIKQITKQYNFSGKETICYSYWHDYKALALALFKRKNSDNICISRVHGWDVFSNRHKPPYLPFKRFIITTLDQTFSVSNAGKFEFEKLLNRKLDNKVFVSRLGKINKRPPLITKNKSDFIVCSCSTLTCVKRVNLIIDILSKITIKNIQWVHFGDGHLRKELEQYAKENLKNIDLCFKGIVPNSEILDFYNQHYIDLFLNVSESEGIPVSIMEALSAGIPVLATHVGGTSESVNNKIGFLVEKDFKINEVVNLIEDYLNSSIENQRKYRENAYNFWKENYNAEKNYTDFANKLMQIKI